MKLRTKTWVVVLIALALMVALMLAIGSRTVLQSFETLEHDQALRDAKRVKALIQRQYDDLERTAVDYGEWVDTVDYARGLKPSYPEENWQAESFQNLGIHAMLVFQPDGRLAGGVVLDPGAGELAQATEAFARTFSEDIAAVLADRTAGTHIKACRMIDATPWMFACIPLLIPAERSEPLGALLVGRPIGSDFVEELRGAAQLPVAVHFASLHTEPGQGDLRFEPTREPDILFSETSDNLIVMHVGIAQPDGSHAATVHLLLDRPIREQALNTVWIIVLQTAGIALLCGVIFHTLLGRGVVSRIEAMHAAVRRVGQRDDLSVRVPVRGNDEIDGLGQALNTMLDTLARGRGERETAQLEREKMQDQLVQAQKMEALGDFAGGIAHDFNNCLTTITGWLSLTREDMPEGSEHRENLDLALASAAHASAVVKQLLVYSRQGEPTLTALSMREILGSSLQLLRAALPKSIQLNLSTTGDDDVVLADATQLKQVVLNLAKNAADAIQPPGTITLSLAAITLPSSGAPGTRDLPAGRYAHLTVHDSGPGIAPEHLERIFEPFFTTKPAGKGTGLGLAVVRSVVLRHRGAIGLSSPPGDGATFHVYLPLHAESTPGSVPEPAPPPAGCRLLVVDDDAGVLKVITRLVTTLGYNPTTATNGAEAWELFTTAEPPFDLVLTDLTMPKLGGMQLGERIFNSGRRAPVVLLSAYASTLDPGQLHRAGFAGLLPKPIDTASLRIALARAHRSKSGSAP